MCLGERRGWPWCVCVEGEEDVKLGVSVIRGKDFYKYLMIKT
jgi:hypothetical protein